MQIFWLSLTSGDTYQSKRNRPDGPSCDRVERRWSLSFSQSFRTETDGCGSNGAKENFLSQRTVPFRAQRRGTAEGLRFFRFDDGDDGPEQQKLSEELISLRQREEAAGPPEVTVQTHHVDSSSAAPAQKRRSRGRTGGRTVLPPQPLRFRIGTPTPLVSQSRQSSAAFATAGLHQMMNGVSVALHTCTLLHTCMRLD